MTDTRSDRQSGMDSGSAYPSCGNSEPWQATEQSSFSRRLEHLKKDTRDEVGHEQGRSAESA